MYNFEVILIYQGYIKLSITLHASYKGNVFTNALQAVISEVC